jgi:hypothetical protein
MSDALLVRSLPKQSNPVEISVEWFFTMTEIGFNKLLEAMEQYPLLDAAINAFASVHAIFLVVNANHDWVVGG